jgi:MFS family permease
MPEAIDRSDPIPRPSCEEQRIDRSLLACIALCTLAVGINTIVGFTVAHWTVAVNRKTASYIVSVTDLALCLVAAALGWRSLRATESTTNDDAPKSGRRRFMAKFVLILSGFAAIVVLAGTLALLTLTPSD